MLLVILNQLEFLQYQILEVSNSIGIGLTASGNKFTVYSNVQKDFSLILVVMLE